MTELGYFAPQAGQLARNRMMQLLDANAQQGKGNADQAKTQNE